MILHILPYGDDYGQGHASPSPRLGVSLLLLPLLPQAVTASLSDLQIHVWIECLQDCGCNYQRHNVGVGVGFCLQQPLLVAWLQHAISI